ncbi:DUF2806 domain-containing protein [Methylobacterium sp. J-077]|uniref:DUF2806 domain-containing protein n=1 Tax=Methylobacterium sp. J-077 TaxID=2836656 RepID=UPI001FB922AD|nr:DUF2806 domain-containing protein [Methylobacterium sp. J-077]MCJ2125858.1 DUF2806 domain-containing protein [Methylobacterium sp. J-077]
MAGKRKSGNVNALVNAEVSGKADVKLTDVVGLGAAAKSPAGLEIARAIAAPLGNAFDTATTALLGRRAARVRSEARVLEAQADAQARSIAATADEEIKQLRAAGRRFRGEELRRQSYIEEATSEAIQIADQRAQEGAKPLDDELTLVWVDGVKETHSAEVRKLYSQILANQTAKDSEKLSGPSMALLKNLDSRLAEAFKRYVVFMCTYGCYPFMDMVVPEDKHALETTEVLMLSELRFIKIETRTEYDFGELILAPGQKLALFHYQARFSERSRELAFAIYGKSPLKEGLKDSKTSSSEAVEFIVNITKKYSDAMAGNFEIIIKSPESGPKLRLLIKAGLLPLIIGNQVKRPDESRDAAAYIQADTGISSALTGALEKLIHQFSLVEIYEYGPEGVNASTARFRAAKGAQDNT